MKSVFNGTLLNWFTNLNLIQSTIAISKLHFTLPSVRSDKQEPFVAPGVTKTFQAQTKLFDDLPKKRKNIEEHKKFSHISHPYLFLNFNTHWKNVLPTVNNTKMNIETKIFSMNTDICFHQFIQSG